MRVITFSRTFPAYHPRAGEPTLFPEKVIKSLGKEYEIKDDPLSDLVTFLKRQDEIKNLEPKYHTIRAAHRWKAGDWFSPRVWSGKPYNSKQIQFAPDIQIKKTWEYEMTFHRVNGEVNLYAFVNGNVVESPLAERIASNDGLTMQDFTDWFNRPGQKFILGLPIFEGQIICHNESIEY